MCVCVCVCMSMSTYACIHVGSRDPFHGTNWIALEEKKVSYDWKKVDLFNKDVRTRALTPTRGHAHARTHSQREFVHSSWVSSWVHAGRTGSCPS